MSRHHASSRRRRGSGVVAATAAVLAATLTGCSAEAESAEEEHRSGSVAAAVADPEVSVRTSVARVHGDLSARELRQLEQEAGRLVSGYLSAAYLHQRPTQGYRGSFPGFTPDARKLAYRDVRTASDGAFNWADEVRPLGAVAFLSVVAPEGRPAGATARVLLRMAASDQRREREVEVRGRLLLTPAGNRWQIFGYDLSVATKPMRRSAR